MKTITIVLEGGLVSCAIAPEAMSDTQIMIIDYDTNCAEADEVIMVPQANGKECPAFVDVLPVTKSSIDLSTVLERYTSDEHPEDI